MTSNLIQPLGLFIMKLPSLLKNWRVSISILGTFQFSEELSYFWGKISQMSEMAKLQLNQKRKLSMSFSIHLHSRISLCLVRPTGFSSPKKFRDWQGCPEPPPALISKTTIKESLRGWTWDNKAEDTFIFPTSFQMELWGAAIITRHSASLSSQIRRRMQHPSPPPTNKHCSVTCLTYLQVPVHLKDSLLKLTTLTPGHLHLVK